MIDEKKLIYWFSDGGFMSNALGVATWTYWFWICSVQLARLIGNFAFTYILLVESTAWFSKAGWCTYWSADAHLDDSQILWVVPCISNAFYSLKDT